jgi:hypothetical protein
MKNVILLTVLFISAAGAAPGLANYFHNSHMGIGLNIGSAPSPTPRDIREDRMPQLLHAAPPATPEGTKAVVSEPKPAAREASSK